MLIKIAVSIQLNSIVAILVFPQQSGPSLPVLNYAIALYNISLYAADQSLVTDNIVSFITFYIFPHIITIVLNYLLLNITLRVYR